jgi:hypothetical protein
MVYCGHVGSSHGETGKQRIPRLAYCRFYCLFSGPNRGYWRDSIDWIDTVLGNVSVLE